RSMRPRQRHGHRAFHPYLERCEARTLLSATGTARRAAAPAQVAAPAAVEPLQFAAAISHGPFGGTAPNGPRILQRDGRGGLAGTLDDSHRGTVAVEGRVDGDRMSLKIDLGASGVLRVVGPMVRQRLGSGLLTFYSRGDAVGAGSGSVGWYQLT